MKNLLIIIVLCIYLAPYTQSSAFSIFSKKAPKDLRNIPELPVYIGTGYDTVLGNPLHTEKVDPGFTSKIFNFTYNKKQITQDGRYLIPDNVNHVKISSCSFNTEISVHRGTESYQKKLNTRAEINGGYKGLFLAASFSQSSTYQKIQNSTIQYNSTVTQAMAQCQNYKLTIDLFNTIAFLPNFKIGVQQSYHFKDWNHFIQQYGSHFTYEVIMGGRAIQQVQYTRESVQKLESINIDINIAAKASFAKFYGDTSFDWRKYQSQVAYTENEKLMIQEIYIGGTPPKNGSVKDWSEKVIQDPMPITYKLLPLSDLFPKINSLKIVNITDAQNSFLTHLDIYCKQKQCKPPTPDLPKPQPANIQEKDTQSYGGQSSPSFTWKIASTTLDVKAILLRSGTYIDQIQIQLSDGVQTFYSPIFGGTGGSPRNFTIPEHETLHQIGFRSGQSVDSLTFYTNKGSISPQYGGNGGSPHMVTVPQGFRIVGLFGKHSGYVDNLGFHLAKTVYSQGQQKIEQASLVLIQ